MGAKAAEVRGGAGKCIDPFLHLVTSVIYHGISKSVPSKSGTFKKSHEMQCALKVCSSRDAVCVWLFRLERSSSVNGVL